MESINQPVAERRKWKAMVARYKKVQEQPAVNHDSSIINLIYHYLKSKNAN